MVAFVVNAFSGMVPRQSARLLTQNQAQLAKNAIFSSGELSPLPGLRQVGSGLLSKSGVKSAIYKFGQDLAEDQYWFHWVGKEVSVVRGAIANDVTERTYYTGDAEPRMTYSPLAVQSGAPYPAAYYKLGIPAPVLTGMTLVAKNAQITSLTRSGTTASATTALAHGLTTGNKISVAGATQPEYNVDQVAVTVIDATHFTYTMAADPGATATGSYIGFNLGGTAETRAYVLTYVSALGEEGGPSEAKTIDVIPGQFVSFASVPGAPSGAYNILKKRLYRTAVGTSTVTYRYANEYAVAVSSFDDKVLGTALAEAIPSLYYQMPPDDMFALTAGPNGMMAALSKNEIMFCDPYVPHAWPVRNKYAMTSKPLGIGQFSQSWVVLTNRDPVLFSGVDPSAMSQEELKINQPCVSSRSIVSINGGVMWASPNGLAYIGPSGYAMASEAIITKKEWVEYKPSSIHAYLFDDCYVGFYDTGTVQSGFMFDPQTGDFILLDFYATAGYYDKGKSLLYLAIGNNVYAFADGSDLTMTWRSKVFTATKPVNMAIAKVVATGYPVTAKLYCDGVLKHTQTVANAKPFRLPGGFLAETFEVELETANDVQGFAIASSVEELKRVIE